MSAETQKPLQQPEQLEQKDPVILETDQPGLILIQMLTPEDDQEYFEFQNRNIDHISKFNNSIYESPEQVTESRYDKNKVRFGIRKDGILIGMEGYIPSEDGKSAEVGILLGEGSTGHGYAASALKALTAYIAPQFESIYAEVDPTNESSVRLLERSGYVRNDEAVPAFTEHYIVLEFNK